ncbi:hypothetical protein BA768_19415 [Chryseobacterium sp. CBo1]|uniref:hypothetical protein n=1 Tax=Chryseobacterium sp. CBo1 TaxID=1869230 RepID=UPI000810AE45|nr:hypothetical protein [Chryseobacterium sp. CBo1]OCK50686.1 hypothetical protein BA768_19415 [Chryseobacterium sp. CBo1]
MTYEEALNLKDSVYGNVIIDDKLPYHTTIAPKKMDDFLKFYRVFQKDFTLYHDRLCQEYCTDGEYELRFHLTDEGKYMIHQKFI